MAKIVNNVKINTTFATAASREQLTSGENLCTSLGKINKYLADLDTGAFTFPANGGNADTLDNKYASAFMQNLGYLNTGSLLDYVLTLTSSGSFFVGSSVTDTPISGLFYGVDVIKHTGGDYVITATRFNAGGVWTNRYNAGNKKWYGWANVADGGNADTLDGKHASDFTLSYIRNNKPLVTSILTLETIARLKWLPVDGATAYAVALYINDKYVTQSTSITNTYYDIQGLTPGTVYLALVQAYVNGSWSAVSTDDLVHFYTLPVASATSDGLVTIGSQTFAGLKTFSNGIRSTIGVPVYISGSLKYPNAIHTNSGSADKDGFIIFGDTGAELQVKGTNIWRQATSISNRPELRNLASGTASANTNNCPSGAWYGKHS